MHWTSNSRTNPSESPSCLTYDRVYSETSWHLRHWRSLRHVYECLPSVSLLTIPYRFRLHMHGSGAGYTLLEAAAVVAMISVLALISVPHIQGLMQQYRLQGAARQIMSDLMFARMKAVSQNNELKIFFLNSYQYTILNDHNNNGIADAGEPTQTKDLRDSYSGVSITTTTGNPIFRPRGTANGATITVSNKAKSKDIKINMSGRVKIADVKS